MRFLSFILLCSVPVFVQAQEVQEKIRKPSQEAMAELRQLYDMKLYHDPSFVRNAIKTMQNIDQDDADLVYKDILGTKDSKVLKEESVKKIGRSTWSDMSQEEQEEMINNDPFEAFMTFVSGYQVPNLTDDELEKLNSINKKTISDTLIMITEAGPDVGSGPVSVNYN